MSDIRQNKYGIKLLILTILFGICFTITSAYAWTKADYSDLVKKVSSSDNRTLTTSFVTQAGSNTKVKLTFSQDQNGTMVLITELPKEALFTLDPKNDKRIPSKETPIVIFRDHNLDGIPDDYLITPGKPNDSEVLTNDGYVILRHIPEHESFVHNTWDYEIDILVRHILSRDASQERSLTKNVLSFIRKNVIIIVLWYTGIFVLFLVLQVFFYFYKGGKYFKTRWNDK